MNEKLDRETGLFIATVFVIIMYALTGSFLLLAAAASLGMLALIPIQHVQKVMGYITILDGLFSVWLLHLASATFGGLTVALLAGVIYTLVTREIRAAWGWQQLTIDGERSMRKNIATLISQSMAWGKAIMSGIGKKGVVAPPALNIGWSEVQGAGGFQATKTYKAWQSFKAWSFGWTVAE